MNKMKLKKVRRWLVPILLTFFVWGIFRWVLFVGYVPTESMEPTIPCGSVIVAIRDARNIKPGDIIVFWHDGKRLVKRVSEIYSIDSPSVGYYVLGDNPLVSMDSSRWDKPLVTPPGILGRVVLYFK